MKETNAWAIVRLDDGHLSRAVPRLPVYYSEAAAASNTSKGSTVVACTINYSLEPTSVIGFDYSVRQKSHNKNHMKKETPEQQALIFLGQCIDSLTGINTTANEQKVREILGVHAALRGRPKEQWGLRTRNGLLIKRRFGTAEAAKEWGDWNDKGTDSYTVVHLIG